MYRFPGKVYINSITWNFIPLKGSSGLTRVRLMYSGIFVPLKRLTFRLPYSLLPISLSNLRVLSKLHRNNRTSTSSSIQVLLPLDSRCWCSVTRGGCWLTGTFTSERNSEFYFRLAPTVELKPEHSVSRLFGHLEWIRILPYHLHVTKFNDSITITQCRSYPLTMWYLVRE